MENVRAKALSFLHWEQDIEGYTRFRELLRRRWDPDLTEEDFQAILEETLESFARYLQERTTSN